MKFRLFTLVPDSIVGVVDAALYRLVADIDGVASCLGYRGLVAHHAVFRFAGCRLGPSGGAGLKRILTVLVVAVVHCESWDARVLPRLAKTCFVVANQVVVIVVVDNHLMALPVTFTRRKDNSSGPFKHRNEIGDDNSLGKQVLIGAK